MAQRKKKCWRNLWSLLGIGQFYLRWMHTDFGDKPFIHSIFLSSLKRNLKEILQTYIVLNFSHFAYVRLFFLGISLHLILVCTIYTLHDTWITLLHIPSILFFYKSCWRLKRGRGPLNQAHFKLNIYST